MKSTAAFILLLTSQLIPLGVAQDVPSPKTATKDTPFVNSIGMKFVPVPETKVLFSIWDTRVKDFRAYAEATKYRQAGGMLVMREGRIGDDLWLPSWSLERDASWEHPGFEQTEDHPIVGVNWNEAKEFCAWLSKKEGRIYRLPTNAEWTAAVGPTKYPWGNQWPPPAGTGNFADKTYFDVLKQRGGVKSQIGDYNDGFVWTSPVGAFSPNWLGIYDMAGNVWQWCEDWHAPGNSRFDNRKECRIFRGSGWTMAYADRLSSEDVLFDDPKQRVDNTGFRCVLEVPKD